MPWIAGDLHLAPPANTVLVSTGKLVSDVYTIQMIVSMNPTGYEIAAELVDVDDTTVLRHQVFPVTFDGFDHELVPFEILPGQSFRIVIGSVDVALGGEVQASIIYAQPRLGAKSLG